MDTAICPKCGCEFDVKTSRAMPFCSDRCRWLDLGRWLDEKYSLPVERAEGPPEEFLEWDN